MKMLNLLLFIVFFSFNAFSQIKTYTYEEYGLLSEATHNYVIPINNKLIISRDKNNLFAIKIHDSDSTRAPIFTLSKIYLKGYDEFEGLYIYIGDANREGVANGKCMILSIYKLDSYLGDKGKNDYNYFEWDKRLSFTIFLKNLRYRSEMFHEQYLDDISMTIFPIKNKFVNKNINIFDNYNNSNYNIEKIPDKEKREVIEIRKPTLYKEKNEEKEEEEVRRLLTTTNHQDVKTKIDSICNSKLLTVFKQLDTSVVLYGHYPEQREIEIRTEFWIRMDSLHSDIVKIDDNIIDNHYSWLSEQIPTRYCTVDNVNYYKHNNDIFYRKQITIEDKFKKEIYGVKNQNGRLTFYKTTPDKVQEWCQKNITTNGFHVVKYVHCNGCQSIIQLITVDEGTKKLLQGKNPVRTK